MSTVSVSFAVLTTHNALCCVFSLHQLLLSLKCTENTPFDGSPDLYYMCLTVTAHGGGGGLSTAQYTYDVHICH